MSDIDVGALRYFRATSGRIDGVAVDMARIEAGLLLIEVDFFSSKKALHPAQQYSPFEMGLGRLVSVDKAPFVGQRRLNADRRAGSRRRIVGLELDWLDFEAVFDRIGMAPQVPATASREAVPVPGAAEVHLSCDGVQRARSSGVAAAGRGRR